MTTDTYISDDLVEAYKSAFMEALQQTIDTPADDGQHVGRSATRAALEAIAPALVREGMERAAKVAEGQQHGTSLRDGEPMYRTCPYNYPGNWSTDPFYKHTSYGSGRMAAAEAIRAAKEEV